MSDRKRRNVTDYTHNQDIWRVLAAMAMNKTVLSRIAPIWPQDSHTGLFGMKLGDLVGFWIVSHYRRHESVPGQALGIIFANWKDQENTNEELAGDVERFLLSLNDTWLKIQDVSADVLLEDAQNIINKHLYKQEWLKSESDMDRGRIERGVQRMVNFQPVDFAERKYTDFWNNYELFDRVFSRDKSRRESLVWYPGAAGEFFEGALCRGEFYAFCAAEKRGKTSNLIDFAARALRSRNRVAYFECGDGDEEELVMRIGKRVAGLPEDDAEYDIPLGWENGELIVDPRELRAATTEDAYDNFQRYCKRTNPFRAVCYPSDSLNPQMIDDFLEQWKREGQSYDVLTLDYMDILAAPMGIREKRLQVDVLWKQVRQISQKHKILVMSATQADAGAYKITERTTLTEANFSESKTKNAHVNGMIGVNVSRNEYALGVARWKWMLRRRWVKGIKRDLVRVAGNYFIDNPVMVSEWPTYPKEDSE